MSNKGLRTNTGMQQKDLAASDSESSFLGEGLLASFADELEGLWEHSR